MYRFNFNFKVCVILSRIKFHILFKELTFEQILSI